MSTATLDDTAVEFWVPGIAAPGGSKKAFMNPRTNRIVVTDDCKRNGSWMNRVAMFARQAHHGPPMEGPLHLTMTFRFLRPKGHFRTGKNAGILASRAPEFPIGRPDLTKLIRAAEDALKGIILRDDSQIVQQTCHKGYGPEAGVWIRVEPFSRENA